jgi:hypothetical protein
MSTPLDYAEFYFDHVDKGESMKAPAEGVAAMSTPRCPAKLNGNPPPTCRLEQGHTGDHESLQPHGILSWASMGVAAPLEPSAQKFRESRQGIVKHFRESESLFWSDERAEAYAAAVSKNLQEELTASQLKVRKYKRYFCDKDTCSPLLDSCESETTCCLPCHLDTAEQKVAELEKEIAALRETK